MFFIEYSNQAIRFLKKADKILAKRILAKIEKLKDFPILHDSKRIENENLFRIRIGGYRVLYEINHKNNKLGIVKIDKRAKVY